MRHLIKTTVVYLFLVAPPFLGLVGILELGGRLTAPPAIGGEWQLDGAARGIATEPCTGLVFDKQATMKVSQSGLRAELAFADQAKTVLHLQIDADQVAGSGRARAAADCDQPLALRARLARAGDRDALVGTLERPGCAACPATPFRATRQPVRTP
jgi:hypothetical protein